ncbi:hypothetical protein [Cesiribacter sp. SM1]|uniref:hypothetical protein n=1 Tax=Cesiribacter sp. SM1 TaxID=2861196 RepID=UPI001CD798B9|nr:hypothetical protein [Cesiribacter sp. SM1]
MILLLLNLLLLCLASWGLYRRWRHTPVASFFWPGLILKILSGWALLALYLYYYGYGDILGYHTGASEMAALFREQPAEYFSQLRGMNFLYVPHEFHGYARVHHLIKLISPVYILSGSNMWVASAWLSFLSFVGLYWLALRLSYQFPGSSLAAVAAFIFWPSMLLWSGSITKEALVVPGIAALVAATLPYITGKGRSTILQWLIALFGAWIVWRIKYYFALPLFALLIGMVLAAYAARFKLSRPLVLIISVAGLLLAGLLLSQLHANLYPERLLGVLVENYRAMSDLSDDDLQLRFRELQPSVWSVLYYTPKALAGGLLMPLPLVPLKIELLPLMAGAENLLILVLLIGAFYKLYRLPRHNIPLPALGLVVYVVVLAVAMAIASPNFGSLLRYRTAYLPFAVFLLLYWLFPLRWNPGNRS